MKKLLLFQNLFILFFLLSSTLLVDRSSGQSASKADTHTQCMNRFMNHVTIDKIQNQPLQLYEDFVIGVCMDHMDIVQNSLKPTFCSFMGVYLLRYLKQSVTKDSKSISLFANDFCANAKDSIKARLLMLNDIYTVGPKSNVFAEKCSNALKNSAVMNPWYLPTVPTTILSFGDLCQAYKELFMQMEARSLHSLNKAVQYSMVLTLELDFNSKEEKLFNECTDQIVQRDPKRFCEDEIIHSSSFTLWTQAEIESMCAAASTQVVLDCSEGTCTPCADEISFMFTRYANLLDSETSKVFNLINHMQANILQNQNQFNSITKTISPLEEQTAEINLPREGKSDGQSSPTAVSGIKQIIAQTYDEQVNPKQKM